MGKAFSQNAPRNPEPRLEIVEASNAQKASRSTSNIHRSPATASARAREPFSFLWSCHPIAPLPLT
jgi:hypothetical protein